jgi:hypothetical protein
MTKERGRPYDQLQKTRMMEEGPKIKQGNNKTFGDSTTT